MSIPSQLPQLVTAARTGALQALALQSGQVLDAKVIGPAPNGGMQVEIKGQLLNLVLPTLVKAGETIRLEVQGSGAQLRLALQAATTPATMPAASPASPAPAAPGPQANIPLPSPASTASLSPQPGGAIPAAAAAQPSTAPPPIPVSQPPNGAVIPSASPTSSVTAPAPTPATLPQGAAPAALAAPVATPATSPAAVPPPAAQPAVAAPPPQPTAAAPGYPQAATTPALRNPLAAAVAATATVPARPAAPAAVAGAVRPVVATTVTANATAHSSPGNAMPQQPAPPAPTPQAALAQMVQASVPRQGSVMALTTALSSIAGRVVLPEPVVRAAQQVLAARTAIDGPRFDGTALQAAVRGSGVFQEANLARGQPLLQLDMKSALLALRQTLTSWLGQQAPVAPVAQIPPPLRGSTPRARAAEAPPLDPKAAPEVVGKHLLERTESALARVRLHQHASLPDPVGRSADLSMDLPVMVGTHQTLMQLQIHRDQHNEAETAAERGWQMRFALSLPDMGEVGAQVTLRGGAVGVMLWATEPAASAALDAEIATLREALTGAGLQASAIIVRHGEPLAAPSAPSGHFVDART
ncbi:flagellar hook-length control protein FliK [Devosia sp. Root635]|uniref:flagellar hook-length control protein FliK n=1 Tax=Devosia sp. Root635 TaxID=1736575 RepID=UPI0007018243|nr:flagellar hook-length control protein FliK [Devosia sp. Root635]KRA42611.1 hypothetical protein ASD80_09230 [Devosia sp. Root635]